MSLPNNTFKRMSTLILLITALLSGNAFAGSQTLTITENKRLEANIAVDLMNRMAVTNDRIVSVFGDDGTFVTQTDEVTGQVFIKPTAENGAKPLSITLITENGLTQDLTLNPIENTATTLILKSPQNATIKVSPEDHLLPGFSKSRTQNIQAQYIQIMKQAILGELQEYDGKLISKKRAVPIGLQVKLHKCYQTGQFIVNVWKIHNASKQSQELQEKDFFKNGDLGITLQKRALEPNEETLLYILGKA